MPTGVVGYGNGGLLILWKHPHIYTRKIAREQSQIIVHKQLSRLFVNKQIYDEFYYFSVTKMLRYFVNDQKDQILKQLHVELAI